MRSRLSNRRRNETTTFVFQGNHYDATIGFDETGVPKEIFLNGAKAGSDMAIILNDTAVVLSVALQSGVTAKAMALSVARTKPYENSPEVAASIIGVALDLLTEFEESSQ